MKVFLCFYFFNITKFKKYLFLIKIISGRNKPNSEQQPAIEIEIAVRREGIMNISYPAYKY